MMNQSSELSDPSGTVPVIAGELFRQSEDF
jgi:hypothetical protein